MNLNTKLVSIGIILNLVLVLGVYIMFESKCFDSCNTEIIKPLFFFSVMLFPIIGIFLLAEVRYFIQWIRHIAWWYILGVLYYILFTDSLNESFLSPSREQVVIFFMSVLFVVTAAYLVIQRRKAHNGN
jgi:uncharacterized membrane protein